MTAIGYKLLGVVVWRAAKWYVRRKAPSERGLAATGLTALTALVGGSVLAGRASHPAE